MTADPLTTAPRNSRLDSAWWWTAAPTSTFLIEQTDPRVPIQRVTAGVSAPECGERDVTVTLASTTGRDTITVTAQPGEVTPIELAMPAPTDAATLTVETDGTACRVISQELPQFAQLLDLTPRL